jgi:WD40 repeat protein
MYPSTTVSRSGKTGLPLCSDNPLASVSPDGRTLLSVGDSPQVYLHHISGSSRLSFEPIAKYSLVPYIPSIFTHQLHSPQYASPPLPASFSTSYSVNGMKFAVGSQEGIAVVWDVRSSKPLKVFETDRTRGRKRRATGEAGGFMYEEDLWDWSRGGSRAPGWGIRSIKFSPEGADGKEVLVFTEVSSAHSVTFLPHSLTMRPCSTHLCST